jgi:hypothetical protein
VGTAITDPGELLVLMEAVYQEREEVTEEAAETAAPEAEAEPAEAAAE